MNLCLAFPALGLETTYGESHQEILKRAYQLAALGVKRRQNYYL